MGKPNPLITGNTFAVKDALRALGGRWDPDAKGWRVPAAREAEAIALVAAGPVAGPTGTQPDAAKPFRHYKCKQCGARPDARGWPRIYRNGVCSTCYADSRDEDY